MKTVLAFALLLALPLAASASFLDDLESVGSDAVSYGSQGVNYLESGGDTVENGATSGFNWTVNTAQSGGNSIYSNLSNPNSSVWQWQKNAGQTVGNGMLDAQNAVTNTATQGYNEAVHGSASGTSGGPNPASVANESETHRGHGPAVLHPNVPKPHIDGPGGVEKRPGAEIFSGVNTSLGGVSGDVAGVYAKIVAIEKQQLLATGKDPQLLRKEFAAIVRALQEQALLTDKANKAGLQAVAHLKSVAKGETPEHLRDPQKTRAMIEAEVASFQEAVSGLPPAQKARALARLRRRLAREMTALVASKGEPRAGTNPKQAIADLLGKYEQKGVKLDDKAQLDEMLALLIKQTQADAKTANDLREQLKDQASKRMDQRRGQHSKYFEKRAAEAKRRLKEQFAEQLSALKAASKGAADYEKAQALLEKANDEMDKQVDQSEAELAKMTIKELDGSESQFDKLLDSIVKTESDSISAQMKVLSGIRG